MWRVPSPGRSDSDPAPLPPPGQGVERPGDAPACMPHHAADHDVIVVRRANTTTVAAADAVANGYYTQTSFCPTQLPVFELAQSGFVLQQKDCLNAAPVRQYRVEIYFVSPCSRATGANGVCKNTDPPLPTLKRLELRPAGDTTCPVFAQASWCLVPLVEGIESVQVEYGLDTSVTATGSPDVYKTSPASTAEWADVVAIRLHVLARNVEQTSGYTETKNYPLRRKAEGSAKNKTP